MQSSETQQAARRSFKRLNQFMILLWRLGLGGWLNSAPGRMGRYLVLVHTGHKSGLRRLTPLNYVEIDGAIYCAAGFGAVTDWYRNLLARPQVEIWLPDGRYSGTAEDISDDPRRLDYLRAVLVASAFAARAAGVDPGGRPETELAAATASYRLIRIRRGEPVHGPGGLGDLAWLWPLLGAAFVFGLWLRRRH